MKLGESTPIGGRPPYIMEDEDLKLVEELAEHGYSKKSIADALGIDKGILYDIEKRDPEFNHRIKKGVMKHCLKVEKEIMANGIPPALYIYWSKTKWRSFYPQELKEPEPEPKPNVSHLTKEEMQKILDIANKKSE